MCNVKVEIFYFRLCVLAQLPQRRSISAANKPTKPPQAIYEYHERHKTTKEFNQTKALTQGCLFHIHIASVPF